MEFYPTWIDILLEQAKDGIIGPTINSSEIQIREKVLEICGESLDHEMKVTLAFNEYEVANSVNQKHKAYYYANPSNSDRNMRQNNWTLKYRSQ